MCALKTFNLDEEVYKEFSNYCKANGISMSKKVDNFIREEMERLNQRVYHKKIVKAVSPEEKENDDHPMEQFC